MKLGRLTLKHTHDLRLKLYRAKDIIKSAKGKDCKELQARQRINNPIYWYDMVRALARANDDINLALDILNHVDKQIENET